MLLFITNAIANSDMLVIALDMVISFDVSRYMQQSSVMEPRGNADMVEEHDQSQPIVYRSLLLNILH